LVVTSRYGPLVTILGHCEGGQGEFREVPVMDVFVVGDVPTPSIFVDMVTPARPRPRPLALLLPSAPFHPPSLPLHVTTDV
jgi:hypothetical protein